MIPTGFATVAHAVAVTLKGGVVVVLVTVTVTQFLSVPVCPVGMVTVTILDSEAEDPLSGVCVQVKPIRVGGTPVQIGGWLPLGKKVPGQVTGALLRVSASVTVMVEPAGMLFRPTVMVKGHGLGVPPLADEVQELSCAPGFVRCLPTVSQQEIGGVDPVHGLTQGVWIFSLNVASDSSTSVTGPLTGFMLLSWV